MPLPITLPYTFANATTAIPLSNLDADLTTLRDGINGIGNGTNALSNVSITGGTITNVTITSSTVTAQGISNGTSNVSIATANGSITASTAGNLALTIDTSQNASLTGTLAMGSSFLRNRIINGDMRIDQRNNGAATANTINGYTVDRWIVGQTVTGKLIAQRNAGSVTPPAGFSNYLGVTSQSAYAVLSSDIYRIYQLIEGFNVSDLAWGTASAQTVTVSFWVRSSLTGTFGGAIGASNGSRTYPFSYTISAANTWEQKSVTIPGDTSGTYPSDNTASIALQFGLGVGATFSGTAGAWSGSALVAPTGAVSVVGTNGATFYLTGVQLEVGTVATPFERRQYGTELALCQRYYQKTFATDTAPADNVTTLGALTYTVAAYTGFAGSNFDYKVSMRVAPTVASFSPAGGTAGYWRNTGNTTSSQPSFTNIGTDRVHVFLNNAASQAWTSQAWAIHLTLSAEL